MKLLAIITVGLIALAIQSVNAQTTRIPHADSLFSEYYHQKISLFRSLPKSEGGVLFLGNSITDGGEWNELFPDLNTYNRGISGDITGGVLNRLDEVIERRPAKIFLLIGTNDLAFGIKADSALNNVLRIADIIHEHIPETELYVQSIFPVNNNFKKFSSHVSKTTEILWINQALQSKSGATYTYIDVYSSLINTSGQLDERFTNDGLHLTGAGYMQWRDVLLPYLD